MKFSPLLLLFALAGCQKNAPAPAVPTTFFITVTADAANDSNQSKHTLAFDTPDDAQVVVTADGGKSTINTSGRNTQGLFTVVMSVAREPSDTEGKSKYATLVRPASANGSYAGGPSTYTLKSDLELTEVLSVDVAPGEYKIGSPVKIGMLNGTPVELTVRQRSAP